MSEAAALVEPPAADLRAVLDLALARGSELLTAGERLVVARMRALTGAPAVLYARLTQRVGHVFAADVGPGVPELVRAGLLDDWVPWDLRATAVTVPELRQGCRLLGLCARGRRADLVERLRGRRGWTQRSFVRVRHRALVRRLEQWALLRRHPDRRAFVLQRMGCVRWPAYTQTRGTCLHPDRRHLLQWEHLCREHDPEVLLGALDTRAHWPPGRLDLRRRLCKRVLATARALERDGDPVRACALYLRLGRGHVPVERLAVRVARCLEAEGRPEEALRHLKEARGRARGGSRLAILRSGRRLAAALRRGWAPDPPLRRPTVRHLRLVGAGHAGGRPRYAVDGRACSVEGAAIASLEAAGRTALAAEGPLWTTLFALLFAEAYFLPVPGALPVPFLTGPLDVGRPAFAARRPLAVAAVLAAVRRGEAPERVVAADARLRGTWLSGAAWRRATADQLARVAEGLGPEALAQVLQALLAEGWRGARGLPDLVVLPGPAARLDAFPSKLGPELALVEVKGPTDTERDGQRVWFDRLVRAGARVELWQVRG